MNRSAKAFLLIASMGAACFAQSANPQTPGQTTAETPPGAATDTKANAYYNFVMGRLYAELAGAEGNRDYINKALQHYQEALKLDPSVGLIYDELTSLFLETRRPADGAALAEDLLKQNPDNLNARKMLGRIYLQLASGGRQGRTNEEYLKKATEQFQIITQKDPKDADSWVTLGELYDAANNSAEAEKSFQTALKLDPENEDALSKMAEMYSNRGDNAKATELLKQLAEKNPSEHTFRELAQQLEQVNDYKGAADALRKALEQSPDDGRLQFGLANALIESGQFDEAIPIYQQLAQENPRESVYPLRIALAYRLKHDLPKAQDYLDRAKKLSRKDDLEVRLEEVNLLADENKTDQAITALKAMLDDTSKRTYSPPEAKERTQWLLRLTDLQRQAHQYDQALETAKQMATIDPDPKSLTVVVTRASILGDQGKTDEAVNELKNLLKGEPSDRTVYLEIAQTYEKAKRWNDMSKALDKAEPLSESKAEKLQVYFMRGAMLERQKKYEASEAAFRKVLELDPDNAGALNYLGYTLADRNVRLDEAYQMIKKAVDLEPDKGEYLDSLGWVYYRQGKLDEAVAQLQHALDRSEDPTIHDHLGDVYAKLGKTREAIGQWQASLREFQKAPAGETDPEEVAKVNRKLDEAQAKLAKETRQR
jgi:tetratricopeptide (TPR) repeat protein